MHYTDLHCDTLFELYKKDLTYQNDRLHLRSDFENVFEKHTQVFAVWTQNRISDEEAWAQFHAIVNHAKKAGIPPSVNSFLAVEGGALLAKDISRVDILAQMGVRMLTPCASLPSAARRMQSTMCPSRSVQARSSVSPVSTATASPN